MQVYKQIANPYMPNGTPDKTNAPSPYYAPGELGCTFTDQNTGGTYLRAQLDSGATAATPIGVVLAGQLAYWKQFGPGIAIVTNDPRMCDLGPVGFPNRVAGVFQLAVTAAPGVTGTDGNPQMYMCDLVIQKDNYPILASGTPTAGEYATANTSSTANNSVASAVGTAAPTQIVGVWKGTLDTGSLYYCDVNIGFID